MKEEETMTEKEKRIQHWNDKSLKHKNLIERIKFLKSEGLSIKEIAEELNVKESTVLSLAKK